MGNKFIAKELFTTTNKMRRLLDKSHQKNDLYLSQARVLTYLYNKQGESTYQSDLEKHFEIRKASVSGLLDPLTKLELISRVESKTDKRRKKIVLTDKGIEKAIVAIETIKSFEEQLANEITNDEMNILNEILNKINKWIIEKENDDEKFI